jgi:hypothetical protein
MSTFRHTPDGTIYFDSDSMPLSFFLTQEAAYALPAGMIEQRYDSAGIYVASDGTTEAYYTVPDATIAGYITNKATYVANYAAYVAAQALPQTLAAAKTYQINLMLQYASAIQDNGVTVSGVTYQSSSDYYNRWKNEHDYAVRNAALLGSYYLTDVSGNQIVMPSVAVLTGIIDDLDEFNWEMQQVIDLHVIGINAITTTIADVLAYDYTTHWATTPYDAGLMFYASYATSIDADYAGGSVTGTAFGGAAIAGGYLDLAHNDARYVSYDGTSNVDAQQVGTILVEDFKPNYSATPASTQVIFSIAKADADSTNLIQLSHLITTGHLQLDIKDQADSSIASIDLGAWSPTSGTDYKITVHYDVTAGNNFVLINDVQLGSTDTSTGTRSTLIDLLRVGSGYNSGAAETSNFKIKKIHVSNQ